MRLSGGFEVGNVGCGFRRSLAMVVLAVVFLSGLSACSFSESSKSSSKILSSPFESSSNSSNSSSPDDRYVADVRDYTSGYLTSGGDGSKLEQEIATVAERH